MQTRTKTPAESSEHAARPDAPRATEGLQRRAGNQAVTRAVQRLRVAAPGDAAEHEADLLAPFIAARLGGIDERVGGGRRLPGAVRTAAEVELGADLADVRVHTGPDVNRHADALDATAYTRDLDVYVSGGQFDPRSLAHRATLGHELTHVAQQRGGTSRVRRAAPRGIVQRQGKGHELTKTDAFRTQAKAYETRLGFYSYNKPEATAGAVPMISAIRNSIRAMYAKYPRPTDTEQHKEDFLHKTLASRDDSGKLAMQAKDAGQVGAAVADAIANGNVRERYTMIYNAVRNEAFKALFVPGQEYTTMASLLLWKGERHSTSTQTSKTGWTWNVFSKRFWTQLWAGKPFRTERQDPRTARTVGALGTGYQQGGRTYGAPLSAREQAVQFGPGAAGDQSASRLQWHEGGSRFQVDETNPWVERVKGELGMPVTSGPSGTTLRMLEAFDAVKTGKENMPPYLLGMIAWMLTGNDHSFHEIMSVAKAHGAAPNYTPGALAYRKHVPLIGEPELRQNVAVEQMFPDEHAYVSQLEGGQLVGNRSWNKYKQRIGAATTRAGTADSSLRFERQKLFNMQRQHKEADAKLTVAWKEFVQQSEAHPSVQQKLFAKSHAAQMAALRQMAKDIRYQDKLVRKRSRRAVAEQQKAQGLSGGLNKAHLAALNVYTSPVYGVINPQYKRGSWIRTKLARGKLAGAGGTVPSSTSEIQEQAKVHGEMMERALTQLPTHTGTLLFRGDADGARSPGDTESIDSFTSTSKAPGPALKYATGNKPALVLMTGQAGGKDISGVTISSGLQQVLLPPGAKFRYTQMVELVVAPKGAKQTDRTNLRAANQTALGAIPADVLPATERNVILDWTVADLAPTDKHYWSHPYGKALSVMVCAAGADAVAPPSRSSEILAQHAMLK